MAVNFLDLDGFNRLFIDNRRSFVRFAYTYTRDEAVAEDVVMEAMMACWEARDKLLLDANPMAYMLTAIKNRALNYLHRLQLAEETSLTLGEHAQWELSNRIATLEACNPEELFCDDIQAIIDDTLSHLSSTTRRIFLLNRYEDKSYREIALLMNMSVKGVEFHVSKTLKVLRLALKDYWALLPFFSDFIGLSKPFV